MNKFKIIEQFLPNNKVTYETDYEDYWERMQNYANDPENELTYDEIAELRAITYDDVKDYVNWVMDEHEMEYANIMDCIGWRDFF